MKSARPVLIALLLLLVACGEAPTLKDGPPSRDMDVSQVPDAVPMVEPVTIAGNKSPYSVAGRTYWVLPTSKGYEKIGDASWYGSKFHGRKTSNGEVYNMYGMTAAHKTLPIPSYVKVTNMANGRQVLVRVNDRGPFHSDRIIDLSWTAAKKLGFAETGTTRVRVVAVEPPPVGGPEVSSEPVVSPLAAGQETTRLPANTYLQTGAFVSRASAEALRKKIAGYTGYPVEIHSAPGKTGDYFKVMIGPISNSNELLSLRSQLKQKEDITPFVVYL